MLNLNKAVHTYPSLGQNQLQHKSGQTAFYQKLQITAGQLALPELLFIIQQHQQQSGSDLARYTHYLQQAAYYIAVCSYGYTCDREIALC